MEKLYYFIEYPATPPLKRPSPTLLRFPYDDPSRASPTTEDEEAYQLLTQVYAKAHPTMLQVLTAGGEGGMRWLMLLLFWCCFFLYLLI